MTVYNQTNLIGHSYHSLTISLFVAFILFCKHLMSLSLQTNLEPKDSFKVYTRIRPFTEKELKKQPFHELFSHDLTSISIKTKNFQQNFHFDHVFHSQSHQTQIFDIVSTEILDNAFKGINGSIFCYGQTSSGKTHTMIGDYSSNVLENEGLLPRMIKQVMRRKDEIIQGAKSGKLDIRVRLSMIEIYNEKIFDLFDHSRKDLRLRQNKKQGVFVQNLTEHYITSLDQAMKFVFSGFQNRTSAKTHLNTFSSRSHLIFAISIVQTDFQLKLAKSSKITLIDLAGSQRLAKTGVQGKMLLETKKINLSLSTLSKVINALSQGGKKHIPYRDSKLTRLLKQSVGGNCLTRLIINLSPSSQNESETVSALRFGSTAKMIKNRPRINKEYTVEELLVLLERAQLKIKQLTKFISEFDKNRLNSLSLPKQLVELRTKAVQPIAFHLVDYNDEESDDKMSIQSSKVSSVHSSSQYFSNDGSGVFSPQNINLDANSPQVKKNYKKPTITSSQSMKLLLFNDSPDFRSSNYINKNKQDVGKTLTVSAFIQNEQENNSDTISSKSSGMMPNFNVEDLSDILGEGLQLRKNSSINTDEKLDFSVKSIHESVDQIRQKCLKRMTVGKQITKQILTDFTQNEKANNTKGLYSEAIQVIPKALQIVGCYSISFGGEASEDQIRKVERGSLESIKQDKGISELFNQTKSSLQNVQEPWPAFKQRQSRPVENNKIFEEKGNNLQLIQEEKQNEKSSPNHQIYENNMEQVLIYKKIIQRQRLLIIQMKKKEAARRADLNQDIENLKCIIFQRPPHSSILPLKKN